MRSKPHKHKILVILGPTACGKSDLAVFFAKKLNGEVVSADSRQVYRGMDIGTGKITRREMKGIRHHLLDVADPKKRFSAEDYRVLAQSAIDDIVSRGKLPIMCGGTGFYIDAVLNENLLSNVPPDNALRKKLEKKSAVQLLLELKKLDPKRAASMEASNSEKNNARRIVRAIEIAIAMKKFFEGRQSEVSTGESKTFAQGHEKSTQQYNYEPIFIGVKPTNEELKRRIQARLLKRLRHGMLDEARQLHKHGISWKRMEELGLEYRYESRYLQGKLSKEEFVAELNTAIWHFARRQMTWFRRNKEIRWFEPEKVQLDKALRHATIETR